MKLILIKLFVVTLFLSSCEQDTLLKSEFPSFNSDQTILEFIRNAGQHKLLHQAIEKAEYQEILSEGTITFFVPKDQVIREYLQSKGWDDFSNMEKEVLQQFIDSYLINESLKVEDVATNEFTGKNRHGDDISVKAIKTSWDGVPNLGPYKITYIDLNELAKDDDDIVLQTVTTNLTLINGVVHVLSNSNHLFGQFAIEKEIEN